MKSIFLGITNLALIRANERGKRMENERIGLRDDYRDEKHSVW